MRLLVAGEDRVDAGKTTFSVGLLSRLRATGRNAVGLKPRAGNDYWFDHDDAVAGLPDGRLYGKDAARLAAAAVGDDAPESWNPLHRLWRPTPGRTGLLGEADRTFIIDRLRTADGDSFVVNEAALEADLVPAPVREALPLADAEGVATVETFNELMADHYLPAFDALGDRLRRVKTAVVESYADIAVPLSGVSYDAVATVAPGRMRVYDGDRYEKATRVASGSPTAGRLEERVGDVTGMLDPVAEVSLPPLTDAARAEPAEVAAAYRPAYEALLATV
ncbi:MAG: ATPase [Halolamina sp.]